MIYTVTLNPSVDYIVKVNDFEVGGLNRSIMDTKFPGGKGINVSRVLKRLNVSSTALGFIGGFTGNYIEQFLKTEGISTDFVQVEEDTRINIKLKTEKETEINGQGPIITEQTLKQFIGKIEQLNEDDLILFSGSIPSSLPATIYVDLIKRCQEKHIRVIADVSGESLNHVIHANPFLIKPNHHEIGEIFNTKIETVEDAHLYGRKLLDLGVQNVIVSMAEKGALFLNKDSAYYATAPRGIVKNSVGAGDSVVAGFLSQFSQGKSYEEAFRVGVACGSATAFSLELCTKDEVETLLPQVKVQNL
ncbi:1-phosphofructokinase [Heyndrickxia ginsengihumi]|uniref:Tagatose-6-phosphate kinase n=1 Tax=Heyndrickxia ginsengihumi TaxID=363870 RepID=A0A0A6VEV9_9BACI|nr:1-phosphofructokinase [Heyndrickxia ginsengihumi]KHD86003.1 phosphofructokinase [Heyndrickxia ginsengihumi]MBE6182948.1 1-phosphofructokinase [Bacillus sp. (in: firmicutes)]MCM3022829.1 1-phosphofructokinase [Heyndrickxia ginsengihumi]NEY20096.1 1-phosphofructokinase [Heyndrickxia ginsengihumi]